MDKENTYDASLDAQMENRNTVEQIRDENKTINSYKFNILIRDKPSLTGVLSRDEVDLIFRLYSSEGANLTQRTVSRYFSNYTFQEFKKILRAFNVTKASIPFAPHILEEKTEEELTELTMHYKENNFLKKLEQDRSRITEVKLKEMTKKYYDLKNDISNFKEFLSEIKFDIKVNPKTPEISNNNTLVVYLSDMHIGAYVSKYSLYDNKFDYKVAKERMDKIVHWILNTAASTNCTNITVCNIGDSLDGYDGLTTRGGHQLPQNMNNKDQFKSFIRLILELFSDLSNCGLFNKIKYYSVEGGNHDGDFGWVTNQALQAHLTILNPAIEVRIFEKFIEHFKEQNHTFILCHGKDAKDMFRNLPLVLNDKVENQINEFLDYNDISGDIHFVKGDLHQTATTFGKRFRYKSVASFFGSSEWIHKNFGNTKAAIDADIILDDSIFETRLILN